MKAIRVENGKPTFSECPGPQGDGILIKVVASSICGTDLHLLPTGMLEGRIPGHEFAGYTPNGTAVAVEPFHSCGECESCDEGLIAHCATHEMPMVAGLTMDGGMAEWVTVPKPSIIELPSGFNVKSANLLETLAVGVRGLSRCDLNDKDRVLVIGAGSIGMGATACLRAWGIDVTVIARYAHQQAAAEKLGAKLAASGRYELVVDGVANESSLADAVQYAKIDGRILILGSFWEPTRMPPDLINKELTVVTSVGYKCAEPNRSFIEAARILHENPHIADAMITHRFPLDGATEAFAAAADKTSGAIKVNFEIAQ